MKFEKLKKSLKSLEVLPVPHVLHRSLEDEVSVVLDELRVHQVPQDPQGSFDGGRGRRLRGAQNADAVFNVAC